jgi:hypothetical protein
VEEGDEGWAKAWRIVRGAYRDGAERVEGGTERVKRDVVRCVARHGEREVGHCAARKAHKQHPLPAPRVPGGLAE